MITFIQQKRPSLTYRLMSCFIVLTFILSSVLIPNQAYAQFAPNTVLNLPVPGTLLNVTTGFQPALIKGIMTHPENPLEFDFIVVQGDNKLSGEVFNEEARNMIKYFLAALTTPEDEMWVNLSPYEGGRIIPAGFGTTEMGRDLLAQDYILKQLTASLMYPEDKLGGEFWKRVHKKAQALYGTTDIPMNTFNKIWIVPKSAVIYQKGSNAFVVENKLKVMLEEDYIALNANIGNKQFGADQVNKDEAEVISGVTSEIVREVLIPEIEHEVNYGQHFAKLRQIANAMVLATWYKQALKESLLGHVYVNQNKTRGIDVDDKAIKDKIYEQYIEAFQKGVYNYIKEYYDPTTEEVIPRKYFSGGFVNEYQKPEVTRILDGDRDVTAADQALVNQQLGTIPASDVLQVSAGLLEASPGANQEAIIQIEGASERNPVDLTLGRNIVSITPKQSESDKAQLVNRIEPTLKGLIQNEQARFEELVARYREAKRTNDQTVMKETEGQLNELIDRINAYPSEGVELATENIRSLDQFLGDQQAYQQYRSRAQEAVINGQYVPQFIFAGAATRLKRGAMYPLNIWDIVRDTGVLQEGDAQYNFGMGPRQIMAFAMAVRRMAEEAKVDAETVMGRQKIVMNVNAEVEDLVIQDFVNNNFYGFNPSNVYFIVQPGFQGYKFENGQVVLDAESSALPYGHGYNAMQLKEAGAAYKLTREGQKQAVTTDVLSNLGQEDLVVNHRINDLTRFTMEGVLDIDKVAFALAMFDQGYNYVSELVENPNNQKGGNAVRRGDKVFLLETSNVKGSPALTSLINQAGEQGAPYHAFRNIARVGDLSNILQNDIPYNLRFKEGSLYLEAVTGDLTQMNDTRTVFFTRTGTVIKDFKEVKNLADAVDFLRRQDIQLAAAGTRDAAKLVTDLTIQEHQINGQSVKSILDKIIKEYDIRGFDGFGDKVRFPQQMDETLLRWIGRGLATTAFRSDVHERTVALKEGDTFVIAGDNGPSTQWVKDNLIQGLREGGIKVIDLGGSREGETSVTSGHLYKSIKTLGAQGGLYVTRSHVEVGTNGAKPNIGGITLYGDMLMKMKETIMSGQYRQAQNLGDLDTTQATREMARQEYYRSLRDQFSGLKEKLESSGMKVSVNFAGGSSTSYRDLFQDLLGSSLVRIIRDRSDPFNEEGGLADPSRADTVALANEKENVIAYSLEHPEEHIINFDLDADRVSLVLNGRLYLGDEIFYPVIEYMLTIDQYRDINLKQPVWVDSRMKSTVAQLAMFFGGIALKHPKGHSKVKATMDIMLQNIARDQGFDSVQAFLDANPGYFNAQAEYSLHMFRTNQRGEAFDDAIDFGLFWLDVFSQVKNKYGQPQWTYADYVQHLTDLGAIAPPVQLNEQRFPMNEEAKMEVMREATRLIQDYFRGRTDFTYEPSWRERTTAPAAFHLVNVDGVFDFETPIGQAFWGWSNTSPKDAFGVQSENAEQTRRLTEIITALLIHSRESVGQRMGLNLGKIDDTETAPLMNMFGIASAVDRLGLDLTGASENDVSTLKGMRDVGAIIKKSKELGLDTSRYDTSSPAQLSDLTKQFAQARSNELEAGILAKYPTAQSALEGLTSDAAVLAITSEQELQNLAVSVNESITALTSLEQDRVQVILAALRDADRNKATRAFGVTNYQINGRQFVTAIAGQLGLAAVDVAREFSRSPNNFLAELGREAATLQLPGVTARVAAGIAEDEGYVETAGIAETAQQAATPVGGIDLNPKLLDLQIRRDDSGVPLPFNQQPIENMNIDGFIPVIINVTPVNNLPLILGLKEEDKDKVAGHDEGGDEPLQLSYMIKVDKFKLNESLD